MPGYTILSCVNGRSRYHCVYKINALLSYPAIIDVGDKEARNKSMPGYTILSCVNGRSRYHCVYKINALLSYPAVIDVGDRAGVTRTCVAGTLDLISGS